MKADGALRARTRRRRLYQARQAGFVALGCVLLLLAFIGALVPVMPTTIFLILAAWSFGRSLPRVEAWMLGHPRFGPVLRNWREHGAMPRRAKWMACAGMAFGYVLFFIGSQPGIWLATGVAGLMIGCAVYVVMRPEPKEAG
jgi:uncharacterized membrane protein YbaN (DUF454 family)